jgi:hypothetical protein
MIQETGRLHGAAGDVSGPLLRTPRAEDDDFSGLEALDGSGGPKEEGAGTDEAVEDEGLGAGHFVVMEAFLIALCPDKVFPPPPSRLELVDMGFGAEYDRADDRERAASPSRKAAKSSKPSPTSSTPASKSSKSSPVKAKAPASPTSRDRRSADARARDEAVAHRLASRRSRDAIGRCQLRVVL